MPPDEWFWDEAYKCNFILTFGSSSIYELWMAGINNVFICDFFGKDRSRKFSFFDSIFIDSYRDYLSLCNDASNYLKLDFLSNKVFSEYNETFDGNATQNCCDKILEFLS